MMSLVLISGVLKNKLKVAFICDYLVYTNMCLTFLSILCMFAS